MGKNNLFAPKFESHCKHVGRKRVISFMFNFPKVHFTMLKIVNMLIVDCFKFLVVGKMCWT
jgi:hypothetical protein